MTPRTIALAALAAAAMALALSAWCRADREVVAAIRGEAPAAAPEPSPRPRRPSPPPPGPLRLECRRPPELRLVRYEDGSARLECGRRLLVRISVPR